MPVELDDVAVGGGFQKGDGDVDARVDKAVLAFELGKAFKAFVDHQVVLAAPIFAVTHYTEGMLGIAVGVEGPRGVDFPLTAVEAQAHALQANTHIIAHIFKVAGLQLRQ